MEKEIGKKAEKLTFQQEFSSKCACVYCGASAELVMSVMEYQEEEYVCALADNDPEGEGGWPHDAIAVALYFCRCCYKITADWDQA